MQHKQPKNILDVTYEQTQDYIEKYNKTIDEVLSLPILGDSDDKAFIDILNILSLIESDLDNAAILLKTTVDIEKLHALKKTINSHIDEYNQKLGARMSVLTSAQIYWNELEGISTAIKKLLLQQQDNIASAAGNKQQAPTKFGPYYPALLSQHETYFTMMDEYFRNETPAIRERIIATQNTIASRAMRCDIKFDKFKQAITEILKTNPAQAQSPSYAESALLLMAARSSIIRQRAVSPDADQPMQGMRK